MKTDIIVTQRVQLSPSSYWWLRGARYGVVKKIGTRWVHVRLDNGRLVRFAPELLTGLDQFFETYRLPHGELVDCDATATKGQRVIDFTLADGTIVKAELVK